MDITETTSLDVLIDTWPDAVEILEAWDLDPHDADRSWTLAELCWAQGAPVREVVIDLQAEAVELDLDDEGWSLAGAW